MWLAANLWLALTHGAPIVLAADDQPWGSELQQESRTIPDGLTQLAADNLVLHFVSRRASSLAPKIIFSAYPATVLELPRQGRNQEQLIAAAQKLHASHALWLNREDGWQLLELER